MRLKKAKLGINQALQRSGSSQYHSGIEMQ